MQQFDYSIVMILIGIFAGISPLFLYSYFGKLATESYEKMCGDLYEFNWHELPNDLKKFFILMIGNAKIPIHYSGFGMFILNLENFAKVRKIRFYFGKIQHLI